MIKINYFTNAECEFVIYLDSRIIYRKVCHISEVGQLLGGN